jgi:hypothetical protein
VIGFSVVVGDIEPEPQSRIHAQFHSDPDVKEEWRCVQ